MERKPLGMIPSKYDNRDYQLARFMTVEAAFPPSFILPHLPEIYDQGSIGQCVAFTVSEIQESNQLRETGQRMRLSNSWIYGNRDINTDYLGEGMQPRDALKHLVEDGVPPYDLMPGVYYYHYCWALVQNKKPELIAKARPQKALSYVRLLTNAEIQTALMNWGPVMMCISVFNSFDWTGSNGIVQHVGEGESSRGGHAMLCVGWKQINGSSYWIVHNSWGKYWGKGGVCFIPFNYDGIRIGGECWGVTDWTPPIVKEVVMDVPVQLVNDRTMVPVRFIAEALGGSARWDEATQTATFKVGDKTIEATLGSKVLKVY